LINLIKHKHLKCLTLIICFFILSLPLAVTGNIILCYAEDEGGNVNLKVTTEQDCCCPDASRTNRSNPYINYNPSCNKDDCKSCIDIPISKIFAAKTIYTTNSSVKIHFHNEINHIIQPLPENNFIIQQLLPAKTFNSNTFQKTIRTVILLI
jgi:hypothetical protein